MPHKDPAVKKAYLKQYHKEWYRKNKEKRLIQIQEYEKTKPLEWRRSIGQKHHLKTRYNLTPEQYIELAESQNYKCAICKIDVTENIRANIRVALSVDHNHTTGALRELLCMKCNYGLGYFKDNVDILYKAYKYLKKHNT